MTRIAFMDLPAVDEHGTPTSKMPNCPFCGEDELGMVGGVALCYVCSARCFQVDADLPITRLPVRCVNCRWRGIVHACEPTDDGDLSCPQCGELFRILSGSET